MTYQEQIKKNDEGFEERFGDFSGNAVRGNISRDKAKSHITQSRQSEQQALIEELEGEMEKINKPHPPSDDQHADAMERIGRLGQYQALQLAIDLIRQGYEK